jgi:hypothetical protein
VLLVIGLSVLFFGVYKLLELNAIVGGVLIIAYVAILFMTKIINTSDFIKQQ